MSLFFVVIFILWIFIGIFFYNSIFHTKKVNIENIDALEKDVRLSYVSKSQSTFQTLKKIGNMDEIYLLSRDKVKLHAYYFPNRGHKWVLLVHDYLRDSTSLSILGKYYHDRGYHVLLMDLRGHGKSMGSIVTMGKRESVDVASFLSYILKKDSNASIVLHGVSLGAFSIFYAFTYSFPKNVKAVVSDSAYTSAFDILYYQLHTHFGILTYPILYTLCLVMKFKTGVSLKELSVLKEVRKSKIPTLLIHSKEDDFVPAIMSKVLYLENPSFCELHFLKGEHGISFFQDYLSYTKVLDSFLDRYHP